MRYVGLKESQCCEEDLRSIHHGAYRGFGNHGFDDGVVTKSLAVARLMVVETEL